MSLTYTQQLVLVTCPTCYIPHGITEELEEKQRRLTTKGSVYCPRGHQWHYMGESFDAKVERLRREKANADEEARIARITAKREATRRRNIEKRINAGVCPHCHRTFKQVRAHMERQHPEKAA